MLRFYQVIFVEFLVIWFGFTFLIQFRDAPLHVIMSRARKKVNENYFENLKDNEKLIKIIQQIVLPCLVISIGSFKKNTKSSWV